MPENGLLLQVAQAEEFAAGMKAGGGFVELHVYEGAGHAFLNKPDSMQSALKRPVCRWH